MNVQLKNIKVHKDLSEETTAFTASLYVDGKRVGVVKNQGQGGSNFYDVPRDVMERVAEHGRSLGYEFMPDDELIDSLLEDFELKRDARKLMKKHDASVVVLVKKGRYTLDTHDGKEMVLFADQYLVGAGGMTAEEVAKSEGAEEWKEIEV